MSDNHDKKLKREVPVQSKCTTNQTNKMSSIMMPIAIENTIKTMCSDAVAQAVALLAAKHGFDVDDAMRDLNLGDLKVVRKAVSSKTAKSKSDSSGDDKPKTKRGPTGYLLYASSVRPETKAEMQEAAGEAKVKPQEVVTAIAAKWKTLSDEEKAVWVAKAKSPPPSDDEVKPEVTEVPQPKAPTSKSSKALEPKEEQTAESSADAEKQAWRERYIGFTKILKPIVKAEMQAALKNGEKFTTKELIAEVAKRWKELSVEEQATVEGAVAAAEKNQEIEAEVAAVRATAELSKDVDESDDGEESEGEDEDEDE